MIITAKKRLFLNPLATVVVALLLLVTSVVVIRHTTAAEAVSGWQAGDIIDDAVMENKTTMSVSQIQSFLNKQVPTCDTNGQQLSEYGGPDLNKDGKVQRWEWGKANYNQTTFPCLRNYKDPSTGLSSAQTIYNASQKYSINPQVLIVLLQKEQGLVQDTWPLNIQYKTATGYGCPDTAPCDSDYYGLTNQINWASTMFRAILDASPTWYTPYVLGKNYIQYNPSASCGGSTVNIANRATQALYNYTPYQPSQAALDAGWGTVSCGAYGNRNFYLYFTNWFGSTRYLIQGSIGAEYTKLGGKTKLGEPTSNEISLSTGGKYQQFENGRIYWKSGVGAWEVGGSIGDRYLNLKADTSVLGYPTGDEVTLATGGKYQQYQGGRIYWARATGAWDVDGETSDHYLALDADSGRLGYPVATEISLSTGGEYQQFQNGRIYWRSDIGAWDVGGSIGQRYIKLGADKGKLGYPISAEKEPSPGVKYQQFEGGRVYWSRETGVHVTAGAIGGRYKTIDTDGSNHLGYPVTDEISLTTGGKYQQFDKGRIYWRSDIGAWEIGGSIGATYYNLTADSSPLGYPTGSETTLASGAKYQQFEGGRVYWEHSVGTFSVYGAIGQYYEGISAQDSQLGLPLSNEGGTSSGGRYQQFEHGKVYWSRNAGAWGIGGSIGNRYLAVGADRSRLGYPTGNEVALSTGGKYQQFENGRIYWKSGVGAWEVGGSIGDRYLQLGADNSPLGYPISKEIVSSTRSSVTQQYEHGTIAYVYSSRQTTYSTK